MTHPYAAACAAMIESHRQQAATGAYSVADDALFFSHATYIEDEVRPRVLVERAIVRHALMALTAAGYPLRLHNGEGWSTERTDSIDTIMDALMATDSERLMVYGRANSEDPTTVGCLQLIYGNDGYDVIADHSVALGDVLQETNDFAEAIGEVL